MPPHPFPVKQGLYDPSREKDGCGIGLVTHIRGERSHAIVRDSLQILSNLRHRGAAGADTRSGDGCGVLTQIPDGFFRRTFSDLPAIGAYGVGMFFLPKDDGSGSRIDDLLRTEGFTVLHWRDVPIRTEVLGPEALRTLPRIRQVFVATPDRLADEALERKLFVTRRQVEKAFAADSAFAVPSFSARTIVYKGLMLPEELGAFYPDLTDPDYASAISMVHSRFSTNTFPSWKLAHPYRFLCHNGEINTLKGNLNWMSAREGRLSSETLGADLERVRPILAPNQSDSACLDNMVEFLVRGGRSLPHAMMMLIPEPWGGNPHMDPARRGFYEYHAAMMEPWDGPAAVCFTDGTLVGATLDRNGLRPCRYQITNDDRFILSSEAGVLPIPADQIREKGRLEPGKLLLVDTVAKKVFYDADVKGMISKQRPYGAWVSQYGVSLGELPDPLHVPETSERALTERQRMFGYTEEELKTVLEPMATTGEEAISSMGADTPLAVLSDRPQLLFRYFKQLFAQVTNPPIDPIREKLVMSLVTHIGPKANLMQELPESCRRIKIRQPVLTNAELQKIRELSDPHFRSKTLRMLFPVADGPAGLAPALERLADEAVREVRAGTQFLILSDRVPERTAKDSVALAPIPSLLGISAVRQRLIGESLRSEVGIIVETGEARDTHHFAALIGFGAGAVNPYLAFETLAYLADTGRFPPSVDADGARDKYVKAIGKGLLKIFSKMGISTIQSYSGAQIFQAIGLASDFVDTYFRGTASSEIGGAGILEIAEETITRYQSATRRPAAPHAVRQTLDVGGEVHYRVQGERHDWNPETIVLLQEASKTNDAKTFAEFARRANNDDAIPTTLRGMLEFIPASATIPLDEVEPASEIVKRFTTGAMSLGAISEEAHRTLAIAMNRIGAKSNTGEGGEDASRFRDLPNGDSTNSAIKQIASARFGVTIHYLANAREIQIKMAQGAKPGEGGQLPGHKVDEHIGRLRHSTPGVQLISPPPHHDIYSIEDLAQLIYDLKNANPEAAVSVKLVSEAGIGVVAAGVVKARADKILISGDSGGTGASPLSSIRYTGVPWELGLAETHQTLLLSGLRSNVRLETDGQLRTGRDVVVAALLGAEEFGFATAPLIVEGCLMMRKCHLNTCPVGIATQDPALRALFSGKPEHVVNYLFFVAEEARGILATLGFRSIDEAIGRTDRLRTRTITGETLAAKKARRLDLGALLHRPTDVATFHPRPIGEVNGIARSLDHSLLERVLAAHGKPLRLREKIANTDRATGTYLSGRIAREYGADGLTPGSVTVDFEGSAGQSFGAFLSRGIEFNLEGESNDYLGKGLSGGSIAVFAPANAGFDPTTSILIGNTSLYGATSGEAYIAGRAGERFAVRNSGAVAVVEGVGDHGCEYMTGGRVAILGPTGRNFAAGMSGGIAYVYNEAGDFMSKCNLGMTELEPLVGEWTEDEMPLPSDDEKILLAMIELHYMRTKSARARELLDGWALARNLFLKVVPTEYKLAIEKLRNAQSAEERANA